MDGASRPSQRQSFFRTLFISPSEPRLRAGWRILLHAGLTLFLTLAAAFPVGFALLLVGGLSFSDSDPGLPLLSALSSLLGALPATFVARRVLDRRSFRSLGLSLDRSTVLDLAVGFAVSGIMLTSIYGIEAGAGWLRFDEWAWRSASAGTVIAGTFVWLIIFVAVGIQEEIFSRGYQLQNLIDGLGIWPGLLLSSLLFGLLHIANPNSVWYQTLPGILAAGLFLAYGWLRTRRLWLPIGLHIGWNFFEGTVFGFPVSGALPFTLIRQSVQGPQLVTGGEFGPEAGLIVLLAMLLGAGLIYAYTINRLKV